MGCNVGGVDRILRIVVGLALVILAATHTIGIWGWIVWCRWPPGCLAGARRTLCSGSKPAKSAEV